MAHLSHTKPLSSLKRAEEYVLVGKKESALRSIFELLSYRRGRTWSKDHEVLMLRFIELCIEERNIRYTKEGLHQFRNFSIYSAHSSVEKVCLFLINRTVEITEKAAADVENLKQIEAVEDLEVDKTPEEILTEAVFGKEEESKERKILVPWLKFLWESYRIVIELLRHQPKLEGLYHELICRAVKFCAKFNRKTEFRRLCDIVRKHLKLDEAEYINQDNVEKHLETRFMQLEVSSELRIWHEGFRTIEDIHQIMSSTKKKTTAKVLGAYYKKLTQLFLVSENHLFHAYAFKKYYELNKEKNKAITDVELQALASAVVLASMNIPLQDSKAGRTLAQQNIQREKNAKLAELLNFDINPQRESIVSDIASTPAIFDMVLPEIKELYEILEQNEIHVEDLSELENMIQSCASAFIFIRESHDELMGKYIPSIKKLMVIKIVLEISNIMSEISLSQIYKTFAPLELDEDAIENTIVHAIKARQIGENNDVKIDHQNKKIIFRSNLMQQSKMQNFLISKAKKYAKTARSAKVTPLNDATLNQKVQLELARSSKRKLIIEKRNTELIELTKSKILDAQNKSTRLQKQEAERKAKLQEDARQAKEAQIQQTLRKKELILMRKATLLGQGVARSTIDSYGDEALFAMSEADIQKIIKDSDEKKLEVQTQFHQKLLAKAKTQETLIRALRDKTHAPIVKKIAARKKKEKERQIYLHKTEVESSKQNHARALEAKARINRDVFSNAQSSFLTPLVDTWKELSEAHFSRRLQAVLQKQKLDKINRAREKLKAKKKQEMKEAENARRETERRLAEEKREAEEAERKKKEEMFRAAKEAPKKDVFRPTLIPTPMEPITRPPIAAPPIRNVASESDSEWRTAKRPIPAPKPLNTGAYRPPLNASSGGPWSKAGASPVVKKPEAGEVYQGHRAEEADKPKDNVYRPTFSRAASATYKPSPRLGGEPSFSRVSSLRKEGDAKQDPPKRPSADSAKSWRRS